MRRRTTLIHQKRPWKNGLLTAAMVATLGGCGSNELSLAPVSGSVTYAGKPLPHGQVVFTPQEGTTGPQSVGVIDPDGAFRMRTTNHDGAPVGKHTVTVHCRRPPTAEETKNLVITELLIPERYTRPDETPLLFEVKDERNVCRLILE